MLKKNKKKCYFNCCYCCQRIAGKGSSSPRWDLQAKSNKFRYLLLGSGFCRKSVQISSHQSCSLSTLIDSVVRLVACIMAAKGSQRGNLMYLMHTSSICVCIGGCLVL